jgi:hypothetical protein
METDVSAFDWIRKTYGVPAKRGGRVEYKGDKGGDGIFGTITGASDGYLLIRLDGWKHPLRYHPTWQLRYLDAAKE